MDEPSDFRSKSSELLPFTDAATNDALIASNLFEAKRFFKGRHALVGENAVTGERHRFELRYPIFALEESESVYVFT